MKETPKLKLCPFCGEPPTIEGTVNVRIECENVDCGLAVHTFYRDETEAVRIWNTRAQSELLLAAKEMETALTAVWERVVEMHSDSQKDFKLPELAALDLKSITNQESKVHSALSRFRALKPKG